MGTPRNDLRSRKSRATSPSEQLDIKGGRKGRKEKRSRAHKRERAPDHPIVLELKEALVTYKREIIAKQQTVLSSTYLDLTRQLTEEYQRAQQEAEEQNMIRQALLAPLGEEVLEFRTSSPKNAGGGKPEQRTIRAKLAERVTWFEGKADKEFGLLETSWTQWEATQAEMVAAGKELQAAIEAEEQLVQSHGQRAEKIKSDLEKTCREHVKLCEKGETEFNLKKVQARKGIVKMLESLVT